MLVVDLVSEERPVRGVVHWVRDMLSLSSFFCLVVGVVVVGDVVVYRISWIVIGRM